MSREFRQGDAYLAEIKGDVLQVPLLHSPGYRGGDPERLERSIFVLLGLIGVLFAIVFRRPRDTVVGVNLARLTVVDYDANDQWRWFDLLDRDQRSLRLLFPSVALSDKERAVLAAVRDHVRALDIEVSVSTRKALGLDEQAPHEGRGA